MRIISGLYGKRRFQLPVSLRARPTTDFAKESLFNVLSHRIDFQDADALDLFAGTGSIAFELLSRGCRQVTAVEQDKVHVAFIAKIAHELKTEGLHLIKGDVFRFLSTAPDQAYDFIFADPPYLLPHLFDLPQIIFQKKMLRKEGILVIEHAKEKDFSSLPFFFQHRNYGTVNFSFFS